MRFRNQHRPASERTKNTRNARFYEAKIGTAYWSLGDSNRLSILGELPRGCLRLPDLGFGAAADRQGDDPIRNDVDHGAVRGAGSTEPLGEPLLFGPVVDRVRICASSSVPRNVGQRIVRFSSIVDLTERTDGRPPSATVTSRPRHLVTDPTPSACAARASRRPRSRDARISAAHRGCQARPNAGGGHQPRARLPAGAE